MARHRAGAYVASGVVLATAAGFAAVVADVGASRGGAGGARSFRAVFASAQGLAPGGAVTLAGLEVGRIRAIRLDRRAFDAVVEFTLDGAVVPHSDASLSVGTGTDGSATLAIDPGRAPGVLAPGATITRATPAESLEQRVGDYIFGAGGLSGD